MLPAERGAKIHFASGLPETAITDQAARILASAAFQKSKRLSRFLTYAVANTLDGNEATLKETILGMEVFDRGSGFDPRTDPIVRIDARRLRARVAEYYQTEGADDPILIEFEPGSYVPRFTSAAERGADLPAGAAPGPQPARSPIRGPKIIKNLVILDLLRQAQQHLETFTPEGILKAHALFERAIASNPEQEMAHLGLGVAAIWMSVLLCESAHTALPRVRTSARRLLELNPANAEAHALSGAVQAIYDFDFRGANASFLLALRVNASSLRIRHARALFYMAPMGMLKEAVDELARIESQEPLPIRNIFGHGWLLYLQRNFAEAERKLARVMAMNKDYVQARYSLGLVHEAQGQYEQADKILLQDEVCAAYPLLPLRQEGFRLLRAGDPARAKTVVQQMEAQYSPGTIDPMAIAGAFAAVKDHDRTFQWLERAYEDRRYWLIFLKSDPTFDGIRSDPRYAELISRMGLPG